MTPDEQKAWDTFAAAALHAMLRNAANAEIDFNAVAELAAAAADGLLEQRMRRTES
jgi:hypothetical protein